MSQMTPESPEIVAEPPEPAAPSPDSERRRAAAYLDLWERHLVYLAAEGGVPPRVPGRRRP